MNRDLVAAVAERDGCPVCEGLDVVRYEGGQAPLDAPFCMRCRRRLQVLEVGADERRRLASTPWPGRRQAAVSRR